MIMSVFWCLCAIISVISAFVSGRGGETGTALVEGATSAVTISIAIAGPLSLWSGLGKLMEKLGITGILARMLAPLLNRLYPSAKKDPELAGALSANVCANLLGLGNAATPMGIKAVMRLQSNQTSKTATDEMCRLVVMNTASIQLIPTTVSALRAAEGCAAPFDILPCVWFSSLMSVSVGLAAAIFFRRVWKNA